MSELHNIISELELIARDAQSDFGHLSHAQLNWKHSPEEWSVGQCFEHLIKANSAFLPEFERVAAGRKQQGFWEHWSPLSGFFGNLLWRHVSPEGPRKLKAPKIATPAASNISAAIIGDFVRNQAAVVDLIRQTEALDTKSIIVTSPFIKVITYSLFDAYRIVAAHEKRHFQQAERVVKALGFLS